MPERPNPARQSPIWAIDDTWQEVQRCGGTTFLPLRLPPASESQPCLNRMGKEAGVGEVGTLPWPIQSYFPG